MMTISHFKVQNSFISTIPKQNKTLSLKRDQNKEYNFTVKISRTDENKYDAAEDPL